MAAFVIDASATLPWCLKDEQTAWTIDLLRCLNTGDRIVVPAHWAVELSNALLMATRRKRIPEGRAILFLDELAVLPISAEPPLSSVQANQFRALRSTISPSTTVPTSKLAKRLLLPFATLDTALIKAAPSELVPLLH